jgi:LmbE family N-acetylglucosaminyl deacetylase
MAAGLRSTAPFRSSTIGARILLALTALPLSTAGSAAAQGMPRSLVAVLAHPDDEGAAGPILARYAREGVRVHLVFVTDGAQGGSHTSIPVGPELARARAEEARCSAAALGARPPIFLDFPDGKLGDFISDRSLVYRLVPRLAEELQRLGADAVVTWGPDGGTGHPDHRLVSDIVTQLARAGAPGVPERLLYMYLPAEGFRVMNPQRAEPPFLLPQAKHFTVRVPFKPEDLEAARRSTTCHRTQYADEVVQRVLPAMAAAWNGVISLVPAFSSASGNDLFR